MPRVLYTEQGDAVEGIPDEEEIKSLTEAKSKVEQLEKQLNDAKQEVNPNWREARQKMDTLQSELEIWKKKASEAGVKEEPKILPKEDYESLAEKKAEQVFLRKYKDRALSQFGEKKAVVESYFNKLSSGEELTEEKVDEYLTAAANAAGLNRKPSYRAEAGIVTGEPFVERREKEDFSETREGLDLAEAMGLSFPKAKK